MGAKPSRAFWVALAGLSLLLVALSLWVATREWFSRDDFRFLAYVQLADRFSLRQAFLPAGERFWTFYRPLSMETYFWVGWQLFGLEASGYFALSLGLHFATAGLVFRLARQLGFDARAAAATAFLAVSRPGSLGEIYYGSVFMYVGQAFFSLLAVTAFLAHLERPRLGTQLACCAGLVLALLCNEAALATPLLLGWAALGAGRLASPRARRAALRAALPALALGLAYLGFRFALLPPAAETPVLYRPALGLHAAANAARLVAHVFGGPLPLAAAALAAAALAGPALLSAQPARAWLLRVALAGAGWLATAALPFALLPFAQGRWAMPLAVPVALLCGAALEAGWRALGARHPRAWEAVLVLLLLLAFPAAALRERAAQPLGAAPRRLVEWIGAQSPPLPEHALLVLLYGAPGLASSQDGEHFRSLAFGGGVLNAVDPHTRRVLRFQDLARRPARNALRPDGIYLALLPDLSVAPAAAALLDRELGRRFEPAPRGAAPAGGGGAGSIP
jgi:hypothetical protein